jgi:lyso-ornithine lipid O-acyltransferase
MAAPLVRGGASATRHQGKHGRPFSVARAAGFKSPELSGHTRDRERSSDTQRVSLEMAGALAQGIVVVLFPEGTSSDGSRVLPFRPALFEAAVASGEQVCSAHISYIAEQGSPENDICYWGGMTFLPHLWRLMSLRGIQPQVRFAAESRRFGDRKTAAQTTQDVVANLRRLQLAN